MTREGDASQGSGGTVGAPKTLAEKILSEHVVEGTLEAGKEIGLKIDQAITQDATGTMACLQFEALEIPRVKTETAVNYVDHNTLQTGFENADDHRYLQSFASKYGMFFSRPGNGICHQVHLERFSEPGKTLVGSDSHTPTSGGMGMIAIGVGGLDVAVAMGGGPLYIKTPQIVGIKLTGKLQDNVSAKDVILEVLRRLGVKGGTGKIFEYFGEGVASLDVYERATITNMGAETGATTSIFPTDERTKEFLKRQKRENAFKELKADEDAKYAEVIEINLSELVPLVAKPSSPGDVAKVSEVEGTPVQQVIFGSCTNSSLKDLMTVAAILKGKKIPPSVSVALACGSRQVAIEMARNGALADLVEAGVRVLENTCGPCIGMGQAPPTGAVSLRTFNRNFPGRSGTKDDKVYLCSPEVAAASALAGKITDPRKLGEVKVNTPGEIKIDDSMIIPPTEDGSDVEIIRGPNIAPLPIAKPLAESIEAKVLLKVGDNISTDQIMPAGAKILPLRSNVPKISEFVFNAVDPEFVKRAKENNGGFVVGGENYGQGSSREHAALAPMYLGVKAVIVKNFARIHKSNLVNFGILPLELANPKDYDSIAQGDTLSLPEIREAIEKGSEETEAVVGGKNIKLKISLSKREREIIAAGGLLNYTRSKAN
ncbi:aconitate hydratase [Candidatus Micrarchaeota archaeon]|nr:aconitate hydratase [Candidatus Micrarchaeota archaeon]